MPERLQRLGYICAMLIAAAAGPPAAAAGKTIVVDGRFGDVVSSATSKPGVAEPGSPEDVELGQEVRVDHLTSADPDWDGATLTVYEQNVAYPSHGTYRSYGLISTKSGETAYVEVAGKWDVVDGKDGATEAPFEGQGKLIGGTGKLQGLSGAVVVKGKLTGEGVGAYSVEMSPE